MAQTYSGTLPEVIDFVDQILDASNEDFELFSRYIKEQRPRTFNYKPPMNVGVGQYIRSLITQGLANKDILARVQEKYTNNNTTYACVAWYRNDMRKKGEI